MPKKGTERKEMEKRRKKRAEDVLLKFLGIRQTKVDNAAVLLLLTASSCKMKGAV
jgi:hypothetical protein